MSLLRVAFLMKLRWGNAGAMESVNEEEEKVLETEDNNSRGTVCTS